ncbi:hypothetical protein FACS1894181_02840 [Bacteroidia bacterium]|nr:hypothetical protein FACS1894181_02840 [Bacteroidia bacterium]
MASVRETLLSYPGLADAGGFLEKVLTDRSLQGGSEYTVSISSQVSLAAADMYRFIGGLPDFTEYKLSESYPRAWYNSMAKSLYIENGEPEKAANIGKRIIVPRGKAGQSW